MNSHGGVLLFAEDPAAAQFVAGLPSELSNLSIVCRTFSAGLATKVFADRGVDASGIARRADASTILATFQPHIVVAGTAENPNSFGLTLIDAAKKMRIPSVGCVDALPRAEDRFRGRTQDALRHAPDWLFVIDELTAAAFVELGFPATAIVQTGNPHYDYVFKKREEWSQISAEFFRGRTVPQAPRDSKVIVFVSGGSQRLRGSITQSQFATYTLCGRGTFRGRSEVVMEEYLDAVATLNHKVYTVFRPHPKDVKADYGCLVEEFDAFDGLSDGLELVYGADLVVGSSTLLLLEAALLGRPTLSIVPRPSEVNWLPTVQSGLTPCVTTRRDLSGILLKLIEAPLVPVEKILDSRWLAPGSLQRVTEALVGLLP